MRRTVCLRRAVVLVLLGLVLAAATITTTSLLRHPDTPVAAAARTADVLANLPVSFEPTTDGFVSRGPGYSLTLTAAGATVDVGGGTFRLRPAGPLADPGARLAGGRLLPGTVNHLTGDDPTRWRTGLPTFAQVEVSQIWPGVDMVWHGHHGRLQHDMVVAPGVDPSVVAFDIEGAQSLTVETTGDLVLDLGAGSSRLARPVLYQDVGGQRRRVPGDFTLLGPSRVGFSVGPYDTSVPLVIDPTLVTSTFLGGSGNDSGFAVAVDAQGNTYVTGSTESADYPTRTPLQFALQPAAAGPSTDVFVTKVSSDGSRLEWSTYLGGSGRDTGYAVAVATDGSVYVGGVTESANFPLIRAAQTNYGGGPSDAFLARIAANGTGLEWSTVIGGAQTDRARGMAVDAAGAVYLTGSTSSTDFPAVNPQQAGPFRDGDVDAFLVKVPSAGAPIAYATRLGGGGDDHGLAVTVDTQNSAYVTGDTLSPGFPTVRPLQATFGGGAGGTFPDGFLAKYNPTGSALVYSTFLGGSDFDHGTAVAVDGQGAAYVAGNTNSSNFPTVSPLQATKANDSDVFVTKVDPAGAALVYSTFVGGNGADGANAIAVDRTGSAHVVGTTASSNMPTAKATQPTKGGGDDAFVLRLDSTGHGPLFSTFLGGRETEAALGVALGTNGIVHVVGLTSSSDFPSQNPLSGSRQPAAGEAFLATMNLVDAAAPTPPPTQFAAPAAASSSDDGHDRRVRILGALTVALLLAAGLQTMYLKRREPATTGPAGRGRPPAPRSTATPGLKVLDKAGNPTTRTGASGKAPTPPRSARSPKSRGGPKGAAAKKAAASQKGGSRRPSTPATETVALAGGPDVTEVVDADDGRVAELAGLGDDAGPPTVATPAPPPKVKPQAPAIAALLEEDLWVPEGLPERPAEPSERVENSDVSAAADEVETPPATQPAPPEWAPFDTGSTPVVGAAAPGEPPPASPAIPPVPAEELSFWDLFPEDLPPARATAFPAEDLLAPDHLALPEGPESAAGRLVGSGPGDAAAPPRAPDPQTQPPGYPPEPEIVIAELLDGPPPTGIRASAEPQSAASGPPLAPDDDFFIDELLADQTETRGSERQAAGNSDAEDEGAAAPSSSSRDQQAIAADRARRRRSRRGGRGGRPSGTG